MNYAKAIRVVRAAKGVSQQELAKRADISKSLISKIESGSRDMTDQIKQKLADALEVPESLLDILAIEPSETTLPKKRLEMLGKVLLDVQDEMSRSEKTI